MGVDGDTGAVREKRDRTPSVDYWLTFDPDTDALYEADHSAERGRHLRRTILIGLVLYNAYNLTSLILMPDIFWESVALRVGMVTPFSLGLAWAVCHVGPRLREAMVAVGLLNAYAIPVLLFWLSTAVFANHTFGELPLTLVFGNMLLALRFRHAVLFTTGAWLLTLAAIATKTGLHPSLAPAFALQITTACMFSLYANYLLERRRCTDYITSRLAILRAEGAESSHQRLQDISNTDPLTGLPNRRHLDNVLDDWLAAPDPVALIMIDIDHFKLYNDTLGHPAGDDCLRRISDAFRRLTDSPWIICARFGGEEFTIAARQIDSFAATRLANEVLQGVRALAIPHPGRSDGPGIVTISMGLSFKRPDQAVPKSLLLSQADMALYQAKRRGRNGFAISDGAQGWSQTA